MDLTLLGGYIEKEYGSSPANYPKLIEVPGKLFSKALGTGRGSRIRGITAHVSYNPKTYKPYSIAVVPKGSSTRVKLHELGHVEHDTFGTYKKGEGSLRRFIRDELLAESYSYSKMDKEVPLDAYVEILLVARRKFGVTTRGLLRIFRSEARRLNLGIPPGLLENYFKLRVELEK